ncbi:MAG TPA: serine/threonine-protein kinase [Terriglobales bacterium]|nr:serine/threonine-protein kinase [Terriglobales bacterium]
MSKKVGRFEILSEIQHGDAGSVYKASDPDGGRIVALKTIRLEVFGEQGEALAASILEETQASQALNSHNITHLYGAENLDGTLCVVMEYVQGNSVATMLARKEGFSIWDLQDIARQSCQALDHASSRQVFHYALEPAKVMVQWDGTVKVLAYGISRTGLFTAAQAKGKPPQILHYMSPEQVGGDPLDARSNLFSLGTILYEMITDRKAFEGQDADQVRQAIFESQPIPVCEINPTVHAALEAVITKALAKDPQQRYQSGQELVADLERCKSGAGSAARKQAGSHPAKTAQTSAAGQLSRAAAAAHAGLSASFPAANATSSAGAAAVQAHEELATMTVPDAPSAMTAEVEDPPAVEAPKFTIDPLMEVNPQQPKPSGHSFSEVNELPPLKEVYAEPEPPPPPPPVPAAAVRAAVFNQAEAAKAKTPPPRPLAKQAVDEIKRTPPQLFVYALAAAAAVILAVVIGIAYRIHAGESDDDGLPVQSAAPEATAPEAGPTQAAIPAPATPAPARVPHQAIPEPPAERVSAVSVRPKYNSRKNKAKSPKAPPAAAPAIVAGQLNVDSNPAGAQVSLDGQNAGVTPFSLANLTPGHHSITLSKPGFAAETRAVDVTSGSRSVLSIQLAPTTATVAADSDPSGAAIWLDGKDSGRVTPAHISLDKPGAHSFVFKKQGYLDETTSANVQMGQTYEMAPKLRALGTTNEIIMGGRLKKVFGGSETAGMGTVSVRTQPKGAQIAVNSRLLDKMSPVEFYLNPGTYVIDITLSGFKSVQRVITVDKNGKVAVEENLDRE